MIMFIHNICIALSGFGSCITVDSVISVSAAILLMKLSKKRSENSKTISVSLPHILGFPFSVYIRNYVYSCYFNCLCLFPFTVTSSKLSE